MKATPSKGELKGAATCLRDVRAQRAVRPGALLAQHQPSVDHGPVRLPRAAVRASIIAGASANQRPHGLHRLPNRPEQQNTYCCQ
jgi:hypothetical protein